MRTLVAVDSFTYEVVGTEIAHVDDQSVDHGGGIDEARGERRLGMRALRRQQQQRERGMGGRVHRSALRDRPRRIGVIGGRRHYLPNDRMPTHSVIAETGSTSRLAQRASGTLVFFRRFLSRTWQWGTFPELGD